MRLENLGERGGANASQLRPKLIQQVQHRNNSRYAPTAQHPGRLQRINAQVAEIARSEALKDATRALKACHPDDVADLRQSSALLFAFAKSLRGVRV